MIQYFTAFVYHILILHFCYLPGFIKKKTMYYFLKKLIFLYKIMFPSKEEIDFGSGRTQQCFPLARSVFRARGGRRCPTMLPSCQHGLSRVSSSNSPDTLKKEKKSPVLMTLFCFCRMLLEEPKFQMPECKSVSASSQKGEGVSHLMASFASESLHDLISAHRRLGARPW